MPSDRCLCGLGIEPWAHSSSFFLAQDLYSVSEFPKPTTVTATSLSRARVQDGTIATPTAMGALPWIFRHAEFYDTRLLRVTPVSRPTTL